MSKTRKRGRGRPAIGKQPLTPAERTARLRERLLADGRVELKTFVRVKTREEIRAKAEEKNITVGELLDELFDADEDAKMKE
jgi:hypothetical protein